MAQQEVTEENKKEDSLEVPWVPFLYRPHMNFRKPKIEMPHRAPHQWIAGILFLICLFLLAGGVYDLAEAPLPLGFTQQGYQPIYPSLNDQFLVESLTAMVFIGLGAVGFFLIKFPTQQRFGTDLRSASFLQSLGIALILLGIIATYIMIQIKVYGKL